MKKANWIANAVLAGGLALSSAVPMNVMATEEINDVAGEGKNQDQQDQTTNVVLPTSITPSTSSVQLSKGQSYKIGATLSEGATDTALTWTSDNTSLVTVGQDGTIIAVGESGTANITVSSTADANVSATITVTVVAAESQNESENDIMAASTDGETNTVVYPTSFSIYSEVSGNILNQGDTTILTTNAFNDNCTNKDVTWSSSDNSVAAVSSNGTVIATGAGTVTITATSVGKNEGMEAPASASITFKVYAVDKESGFKYSVNDGNVTLEKYTGTDTEVTIPSTINGKTVTSIGKNAFQFSTNQTKITKVTIPNTVTTIDEQAFNGCTNLAEVEIPSSVKTIGKRAFYNTALTNVTIPEGVTTIGQEAFYECKSLESITIPSSVRSIGQSAFNKAAALKSVTISNGVTSIGPQAFYNCSSLESVTIPASVKSIGNNAFGGTTSIETVSLPDSITSIGSRGALKGIKKIVVNKDTTTAKTLEKLGTYTDQIYYNQAPEITCSDVTIRKGTTFYALDGVTATDDLDGDLTAKIKVTSNGYKDKAGKYTIVYEVQDSNGLTTTKKKSVTVVTEYPTTFVVYTNKKSMVQGDELKLTTNGFSANCLNKNVIWSSSDESVATVDQDGNVTALGAGTVTITATSVGKNEDMDAPASATATLIVYGIDEESGFKYSVNDNNEVTLEKYMGTDTEITIPSTIDGKNVTNVGKWSFAFASNKTKITKVTIPNTVTTIDEYAFNGCTNLAEVEIPSSVKTIGKRAFYNTALTNVTIPEGVTSIGKEAFYNCKNLESVTIPSSVTSIGAHAFSGTALKTITLPDSIDYISTDPLKGIEKIIVNKDTTTAKTLEALGIYSDQIYYNQAPEITCENVTIKKGTAFNVLDGVSATDDLDSELQIQVIENNYKDEAGTYTIVYEVQDSNGLTTRKERTVTVTEDAKKEDTKSDTNKSTKDKSSKTNKSVNTSVRQSASMFSLSAILASLGYVFVRKNKDKD